MSTTKKLLTLDQLVEFCQNNQLQNFNANESGYKLAVQVPGSLSFSNNSEDLLSVKVKVCHTNRNRNNSFISEENMKKHMGTLKYKPLLASIIENENGELDFNGHDMEIEFDEDGNEVIKYIEKQIGTFTADEPYLEYDEDQDKTYVIATAVIPRNYTEAADIIERKNGTKVSCELVIDSMAYNSKEKYLELQDFYFSGCACLGDHVGEGMQGSRLDIQDFSENNNSMQFSADEKLIEVLDKLNTTLSKFNINEETQENTEEGGNETDMNHFEELLNKYNKSVEDIDFDYSEMTDEELDAKFAELFEEENESENEEGSEPTSEESEEVETTEGEVTVENSEEETETEGEAETENEAETEVTETEACGGGSGSGKKKKNHCLISLEDKEYNFDLSLDDIQYALYSLVNDMYSEADNTWYSVSVYEGYVIMNDWWNGRNYKQTYSREEDNFSLTGDRVEVYANWLTKEEEDNLAEMRANYSSIESELNEYKKRELHSKLDEILNADEYSAIAETEEFKALKETMDSYSAEELQTKADLLYAKFAKANFAMTKPEVENKPKMVFMAGNNPDEEKVNKPYGGIFDRFNK